MSLVSCLLVRGAFGDAFVIEAESPTLTDPEAPSHPLTVVYEHPEGIDPTSLGDDDIIVGRHSLFGPGLGSAAPHARLESAQSEDDGRRVLARYVLDRPEGGWFLWESDDLTLQIAEGSVRDLEGEAVESTRVIGILRIALQGERPRPLWATFARDLVIEDLLQPFADIDVAYVAKEPLRPSDFGSHDLFVLADREVLVPTRLSLSIPLDDEGHLGTHAEARYRVYRPVAGWGWRRLTVFADVLPPPFAPQRLGEVLIAPHEKLAMSLRTTQDLKAQRSGDYFFDVVFSKTGHEIDRTSLGDDDVIVEQPAAPGPGLLMTHTVLESTRTAWLGVERRLVARYRVPEPEGGWSSWQSLSPQVRLQPESVQDATGQSLPSRVLGSLPLGDDLFPLPQQLVFEDWVRDLSKQLGLEKPPSSNTDGDGDGENDLDEVALGTDPTKPTETHPVRISTVKINGKKYITLRLSMRPQAAGGYLVLEGSEDGITWAPAEHCFDPLFKEQNTAAVKETLVWRARHPQSEMKKKFFRLRVKES